MACRLFGTKPLPDQCWYIVEWTIRNKLQWNLSQNTLIFIEENAFKSVDCKMSPWLCWMKVVRISSSFKLTIYIRHCLCFNKYICAIYHKNKNEKVIGRKLPSLIELEVVIWHFLMLSVTKIRENDVISVLVIQGSSMDGILHSVTVNCLNRPVIS